MFAYCGNDPINFADSSGTRRVAVKDLCGGKPTQVKTKPYIRKSPIEMMKNKDGSYSLYDNKRFGRTSIFHDQGLVVRLADNDGDLLEQDIILAGASFDCYTGGWEWEYVDLSLLDFGHAEITANSDVDGFRIGALASIWSPSIAFDCFGVNIEIGAEVGCVGRKYGFWNNGFEIKSGDAIGFSIIVDWEG